MANVVAASGEGRCFL